MERRLASGFVLVVVAVMSACTAGAEPPGTTSPVPSAADVSPSPAVAGSVTATSTPTVAGPVTAGPGPASTEELTCAAPDEHVLGWLRTRVREDLPASDVVVVEVGPGDDPSRTWSVVAARSYSDSWGASEYNPVSYLTTAPDGAVDADWIAIGRALQAPKGSVDWSKVSWTGDRLARGQQAQALALSCLDGPR
ncbi:hypothetical protein Cfla_0400 [Cellulomonas flavigena DSM 20109]|uniref:Lipoprotein n=1 Tax=Cellulomonas flavigena (strain ATCC 482 / DSM 20109 / BCRC 11376 / JCM 18109 / NBRC 3775 / NCIMB 8073 / NRS 134) TaxID=446466 RepID=D5UHP3_CELFN|nr:hypothetical protein [Cellulomonas flavigena]ADG73317.1 hypothetical protein Cfla_0400 [Cellulomonas flavigena DSM 20109]